MAVSSGLWVPHQRETWPWRIGVLKKAVTFSIWHGHDAEPEFTTRTVSAGTKVKIVMVSRMGDIGITDDLTAENGYHARVLLGDIDELKPVTERPYTLDPQEGDGVANAARDSEVQQEGSNP